MNLLLSDPAFLSVAAGVSYDADAQAYITAVETADGLALETAVKHAINDFVLGCKADGIWSAIKASCILAGARTLNGALQPLVGTAPMPFNFVPGDYNRKTGLKGNASTKYLDSNVAPNSVAQNNVHISVYTTQAATTNVTKYIGAQDSSNNATRIIDNSGDLVFNINSFSGANFAGASQRLGLMAASVNPTQAASNQMSVRYDAVTTPSASNTLSATISLNLFVFGRNLNGSLNQPTDARIAFYSFGESLDLALLDNRISTLISTFNSVLP